MTEIWNETSGFELANVNEGESVTIDLPVQSNSSVSVITGKLPDGLFIEGTTIQGTPAQVSRETEFRFVLRAFNGASFADRTFSVTVIGSNDPEWQTDSGLLPIGKGDAFYILDNGFVDFQLEATDPDVAAGQTLKYFIASGDGELPPGISLSESGRLTGIVDPILGLEKQAGDGAYDESRFDRYPYDFALREGGRFESPEFYDVGLYDFYSEARTPRKLNRYFEFTVSVSDGDSVTKRTFKIFVVGDDFLRADNTIMQVGTGVFTSDNTFLRTPVWLTPSNLGFKRANNFITLFLEVIDTNTLPGRVVYEVRDTNPGTYLIKETQEEVEGFWEISQEVPVDEINNVAAEDEDDFEVIQPETKSELPPGTEIDQTSGEIFGRVPYQPAVTIEYKFTVNARRISSQTTEIADESKTFTVKLLGEIDSTIQWLTDPDLGTVPSNHVSLFKVEAQSNVPDSFLLYNLESGDLPPGLTLSFTGEIFGKISSEAVDGPTDYEFTIKARDQFGFSEIERTFTISVTDKDDKVYSDVYYKPLLPADQRQKFRDLVSDSEIFDASAIYRSNDPRFGIQTDPKILVFAGLEQSEIEQYVAAYAKYASRKTLKIRDVKAAVARAPGTNTVLYEVVYLDLYDPYEKNSKVRKKISISNSDKILVNSIRRGNEFENRPINNLTVGTRLFPFNEIYFGNTLDIETRDNGVSWFLEYDSVLETRDGTLLEPDYEFGSSTNLVFEQSPENTITTDSNSIKVSNVNDTTRYITNISNFRDQLREVGATERNFLPLWMRTAQPGTVQELGYTLAVPLAYCKPGESKRILSGIRTKDIDFRSFEFDVDRLIVESTAESAREKYIVFGNYQFNLA
jgi:hypothetical protein